MRYIKFKYRDSYSNGKWCEQKCRMSSLAECIDVYGLDEGNVEYKIVENLSEEEYYLKLEKEAQEKRNNNDYEME